MDHFAVVVFMIVTGQMNHPVQDQHPQFRGQSVRAAPRESPRRLRRNYNIAYVSIRVDFRRSPKRMRATRSRPPGRKREHVGWPLFISKFTVQPRHGRIAHKTDRDTFFREPKLALHAFAEPGQWFHSQWYAALAI